MAGVLAPALAFVPPSQRNASLWLGWSLATASVTTLAMSRHDAAPPASDVARLLATAAPATYVLAVAVLRHSQSGAASGFSPLVLLPLFWVALAGDRRSLWLLCVAIAAAFVVPIVALGPPEYPSTEWRRAVIWLAVAPVAGLVTQHVVAQARAANLALEQLARTDPLTGLLNRRGFSEVAERELLRARRTGEPVVVAMLDLDHFKRFNDDHGHAGGDRLLVGAADGWRLELRDIDVLGRWGGEEFVLLLPRCPVLVAHNVLDRVRAATPEAQTCSVGLALWRPTEQLADVVGRADDALYAAKSAGRDRVAVAD